MLDCTDSRCIEIASYDRQEEMVEAIVNTTDAIKLSEKNKLFWKVYFRTKLKRGELKKSV